MRACKRVGITEALVPEDFPLAAAERLRREGIAMRTDSSSSPDAAAPKTPGEIAGIRRAQAATIRAMTAIRDGVHAGGATSESLRAAARRAITDDNVIPST